MREEHHSLPTSGWSPRIGVISHMAASAYGLDWAIRSLGPSILRVAYFRLIRGGGPVWGRDGLQIDIRDGNLLPLARAYYLAILRNAGCQVRQLSRGIWEVGFTPTRSMVTPIDLLFPTVEVFLDKVYWLPGVDLRGRLVVDAGASAGDSTLFFAWQGARVIALEPVTRPYQFTLHNVRRNGLESQVTVLQKRLGPARSSEGQTVSIEDVSRIAGSSEIELLKLDCDGCESDVLLYSEESILRKVHWIVMEYENGVRHILSRLSRVGFESRSIGGRTTGYLLAHQRHAAR